MSVAGRISSRTVEKDGFGASGLRPTNLASGNPTREEASLRLLIAWTVAVAAYLSLASPAYLAARRWGRVYPRKSELRRAELDAADRHFERLREGRPESLETTSLHLDILSDLKRIHSHICSVVYPVLQAAGELPAREAAKSDAAKSDAANGAFAHQRKLP